MKKEYNFSKAGKNPYTKLLKKQITINISEEVLDYLKNYRAKHQSLIKH